MINSLIAVAVLAQTIFHPGYCFPVLANGHDHRPMPIKSYESIALRDAEMEIEGAKEAANGYRNSEHRYNSDDTLERQSLNTASEYRGAWSAYRDAAR